MKVIQITEKQQKIKRSVHKVKHGGIWDTDVKHTKNRGSSWENRENQVTETRVTTDEKEEVINGIRKNKENKV